MKKLVNRKALPLEYSKEFEEFTDRMRKERDEADVLQFRGSGLTGKEEAMLLWMKKFMEVNLQPPSISDVSRAFRITVQATGETLRNLVRLGALYRCRQKYIPAGARVVFDSRPFDLEPQE